MFKKNFGKSITSYKLIPLYDVSYVLLDILELGLDMCKGVTCVLNL